MLELLLFFKHPVSLTYDCILASGLKDLGSDQSEQSTEVHIIFFMEHQKISINQSIDRASNQFKLVKLT